MGWPTTLAVVQYICDCSLFHGFINRAICIGISFKCYCIHTCIYADVYSYVRTYGHACTR